MLLRLARMKKNPQDFMRVFFLEFEKFTHNLHYATVFYGYIFLNCSIEKPVILLFL
jgi:hypothetical protein